MTLTIFRDTVIRIIDKYLINLKCTMKKFKIEFAFTYKKQILGKLILLEIDDFKFLDNLLKIIKVLYRFLFFFHSRNNPLNLIYSITFIVIIR